MERQVFEWETEPSFEVTTGLSGPVKAYAEKDGTRYEIMVFYMPKGISFGSMCNNEPVYLVLSGFDKACYSFTKGSYISWDYVGEKFRIPLRQEAINVTELIRETIKKIEELNSL